MRGMRRRCVRPAPTAASQAGSRRISVASGVATMLPCSPISHGTEATQTVCRNCAWPCATAAMSRPVSNSDRAFCIRPVKLIKAARIAACSCRSRLMTRRICPFPAFAPVSVWSRRRKRAAISAFWSSAAGALCAFISAAICKQAFPNSPPRSSARYPDGALPMQIGVIGLGRMGGNISRRLMENGHEVVVYDHDPKAIDAVSRDGAKSAEGLDKLIAQLRPPRPVWVMLPAGQITEDTIGQLGKLLDPGDIVLDGGNTFWKDDIRRAKMLKQRNIHHVDVGTSGGVWGIERGYCMMIGGDKAIVDRLDPIFKALAPGIGDIERPPGREGRDPRIEQGYIHAGPVGAGHFVKMVHNGIEYGLMQAYAEGFDILKNANLDALPAEHRFDLDIADIAEVWRRGSVIPSWLLDLTASALAKNPTLGTYSGFVEDSGEGRWTVNAAIDEAVPAEVLTAALFARFRSRKEHTFAEKILSAMREGFGGHKEPHEAAQGAS